MLWIPFAHRITTRPLQQWKGARIRQQAPEPRPMIALHLVRSTDGVVAEHPVCTEREAKRVPVTETPALAPGLHLTCSACLAVSLTMLERKP